MELQETSTSLPLVTRRQLALLLGVHMQTVTKLEREGLPIHSRGRRGRASMYHAPDVIRWQALREASRQQAPTVVVLADERARLIRAQWERLERENRFRDGELVEQDVVVAEGRSYTKAWVARVRALPRRLVMLGIITRDQESAAKRLCYEMLTDIASWKTTADCERAIAEAERILASA